MLSAMPSSEQLSIRRLAGLIPTTLESLSPDSRGELGFQQTCSAQKWLGCLRTLLLNPEIFAHLGIMGRACCCLRRVARAGDVLVDCFQLAKIDCLLRSGAYWPCETGIPMNANRCAFRSCMVPARFGLMLAFQCSNIDHSVFCMYFSRDVIKIQQGIGEKNGLIMQWISSALVGLIVAFVLGPLLAVVLLACAPLLAICAAFVSKVRQSNTPPVYELCCQCFQVSGASVSDNICLPS